MKESVSKMARIFPGVFSLWFSLDWVSDPELFVLLWEELGDRGFLFRILCTMRLANEGSFSSFLEETECCDMFLKGLRMNRGMNLESRLVLAVVSQD